MTESQLISIFLDNYKELSIYAIKLTGNIMDAEDLLSNLLIKIYTDPQLLSADNPLPYFKTCLRNSWNNDRKRSARVKYFDPELISTLGYTHNELEAILSDRETRNLLNEVFQKYSPELIDAFIRFHLEGYTTKELASQLGMNHNTLSQHFSRMRSRLRTRVPYLWNMIMLVFLNRGNI